MGDGLTTFNAPDLRGRTLAGKDDMGGIAANRLTSSGSSVPGATLGAVGGAETQTLTLGQLPTGITSAGTNTINVASNQGGILSGGTFQQYTGGTVNSIQNGSIGGITASGANLINVTSTNTSGSAHPIVQPTIVCNYIIRII
jgi:microcystin-dependent protein